MRSPKFFLLLAGLVLLTSLIMYSLAGSWEIFGWVFVALIWWTDDYLTRGRNDLLQETLEEGTEKMKRAVDINNEIIKKLKEEKEDEE